MNNTAAITAAMMMQAGGVRSVEIKDGRVSCDHAGKRINTTNPIILMESLWSTAKFKPVLIDKGRGHTLLITKYTENGLAKMGIQILLKSDFIKQTYKYDEYVEDVIPAPKSTSKPYKVYHPKQLQEVLNEDWFKEMQNLINMFNDNHISNVGM